METILKELTEWQKIHRLLPPAEALQKRLQLMERVQWSFATFYCYLNKGKVLKEIYKPHIAEVYGVEIEKIFPPQKTIAQ